MNYAEAPGSVPLPKEPDDRLAAAVIAAASQSDWVIEAGRPATEPPGEVTLGVEDGWLFSPPMSMTAWIERRFPLF